MMAVTGQKGPEQHPTTALLPCTPSQSIHEASVDSFLNEEYMPAVTWIFKLASIVYHL